MTIPANLEILITHAAKAFKAHGYFSSSAFASL